MLLTFDVVGERFSVWITNQSAIDQALALQRGTSDAKIPVGRLRRGPGQGSHNVPYRWHMDPDDIAFAQVAIEVCDGTPSFVDDNVDYFADVVVRYCPWLARLVRLDDYRSERGTAARWVFDMTLVVGIATRFPRLRRPI